MKKEKLFTIGQFASLHQINKKTLMWYDEVGLFHPVKVERNGYRYYTYYQSSELDTILMMRELNMSIPEIKEFLEHRSAEAYLRLLQNKSEELLRKITCLKKIRKNLREQEASYLSIMEKDLSQIEIADRKEEYLYFVACSKDQSLDLEIEKMIDSVKKHHISTLHDTSYGSVISVSSLLHSDFEQYDSLFMKVPKCASKKEVHVKPGGKYLLAYCTGPWEKLPAKYREILAYCREHQLCPYGYSYEMGINEMCIDSMEDYITQIEIPIKTKTVEQ